MRLLVLKARSHSLQVEFTYIKSGKQERFLLDSNIKSFPLSLCLTLYLALSFSLCDTDSSARPVPACSCVAAARDGKHIAPSITSHSSSPHTRLRRSAGTEATFGQPACKKNAKMTNTPPPGGSGVLIKLYLFQYPDLFQMMFPFPASPWADTVLTVS